MVFVISGIFAGRGCKSGFPWLTDFFSEVATAAEDFGTGSAPEDCMSGRKDRGMQKTYGGIEHYGNGQFLLETIFSVFCSNCYQ